MLVATAFMRVKEAQIRQIENFKEHVCLFKVEYCELIFCLLLINKMNRLIH